MTAFDANSQENNPSQPIARSGRHIVRVTSAYRMRSAAKKDAAIVVSMEGCVGEETGRTINRMFMCEGAGIRWFANLLRALHTPKLEDIFSDAELSTALTRMPIVVACAWGKTRVDDSNNALLDEFDKPLRYLEVRDVYGCTPVEMQRIASQNANLPWNEHATAFTPRVDAIVEREVTPEQAQYDEAGVF